MTYSLGYTTDGTYGQQEAIQQPITITDNSGKITHLRYDSECNLVSITDPNGNRTDATYDISNRPVTVLSPPTGESGSGRCYASLTYMYPSGPPSSEATYDESNVLLRQTTTSYGLDGEVLSTSGSTEPVSYAYDGLNRLKFLTDGGGNTTAYTYDANGCISAIRFGPFLATIRRETC
jgi:YD repeat-containing protein